MVITELKFHSSLSTYNISDTPSLSSLGSLHNSIFTHHCQHTLHSVHWDHYRTQLSLITVYFSYFRTRPSLSSTCVIPGNPSVSSFYIIPGRGPHLAPLVLSLDTQPPFSRSHSTNLHPLASFQTHPSIQLLSSVVLFQHKLFIHSAPLTLFQNTLSLST
jgi:hypothetical protein